MTPIAYIAANALLLTALCRAWLIRPTIAERSQNSFAWITVRPVSFYAGQHGDMAPTIQRAVYAQERVEMVLRHVCGAVAGILAVIVMEAFPWASEPSWSVEIAPALGAQALATVLSYPLLRRHFELMGHAAELAVVDDGTPTSFAASYRVAEARKMARDGSAYGSLFAGRDVASSLRRWEPRARLMLRLITPALNRFNPKENDMSDPNPIDPTYPPVKPPEGDETSVLPKKPKPKPGGEE